MVGWHIRTKDLTMSRWCQVRSFPRLRRVCTKEHSAHNMHKHFALGLGQHPPTLLLWSEAESSALSDTRRELSLALRNNAAKPTIVELHPLMMRSCVSESFSVCPSDSSAPNSRVQACWPIVIVQFSMAICIATLPTWPASSAALFHTATRP